jgi:hypothetical protein
MITLLDILEADCTSLNLHEGQGYIPSNLLNIAEGLLIVCRI